MIENVVAAAFALGFCAAVVFFVAGGFERRPTDWEDHDE